MSTDQGSPFAAASPAEAKFDEDTSTGDRVARLIEQIDKSERDIAEAAAALGELTKNHATLVRKTAPEIMAKMGLSEAVGTDGKRLVVKDKVAGSLPKELRPVGHAWLDSNGHGAMIKREVVVALGMKSKTANDLLIEKIVALLEKEEISADVGFEEKVETNTLSKFVREAVEERERLEEEFRSSPISADTPEEDAKKIAAARTEAINKASLPECFVVNKWSEAEVLAPKKTRGK